MLNWSSAIEPWSAINSFSPQSETDLWSSLLATVISTDVHCLPVQGKAEKELREEAKRVGGGVSRGSILSHYAI